MGGRVKIRLTVLLLLVLLSNTVLPVPANAIDIEADWLVTQPEQLTGQLTRELFEANWQLKWIGEEKEKLLVQQLELEHQMAAQEEVLELLLIDMQAKWDELANWLRFIFINGMGSFLQHVFAAETFADLFIFWYLAEKIIAYQTELVNEFIVVRDELAGHQQALAEARDEKAQRIRQLELMEVRLITLSADRQLALTAAQQAQITYGINILAEEEYWSQLVVSLEELLTVFRTLEWDELEPRKIQLNLRQRKAVAEFWEEDLARIVDRSRLTAGFQLKINEAGLLFTRQADRAISFQAELSVNDNYLWLKPKAILIDNIPLSTNLVQQLVQGYNLSAPLPEVEPGVTASNIWSQKGAVLVEFRLD